MGKKDLEVPGNALASAANRDQFLEKIGQGWLRFLDACQRLEEDGVYVTGLSVRGQPGSGGESLVVLRADSEVGRRVAFHSVDEDMTLWTSLANRMRNNSLKWKEDQYED